MNYPQYLLSQMTNNPIAVNVASNFVTTSFGKAFTAFSKNKNDFHEAVADAFENAIQSEREGRSEVERDYLSILNFGIGEIIPEETPAALGEDTITRALLFGSADDLKAALKTSIAKYAQTKGSECEAKLLDASREGLFEELVATFLDTFVEVVEDDRYNQGWKTLQRLTLKQTHDDLTALLVDVARNQASISSEQKKAYETIIEQLDKVLKSSIPAPDPAPHFQRLAAELRHEAKLTRIAIARAAKQTQEITITDGTDTRKHVSAEFSWLKEAAIFLGAAATIFVVNKALLKQAEPTQVVPRHESDEVGEIRIVCVSFWLFGVQDTKLKAELSNRVGDVPIMAGTSAPRCAIDGKEYKLSWGKEVSIKLPAGTVYELKFFVPELLRGAKAETVTQIIEPDKIQKFEYQVRERFGLNPNPEGRVICS